MAGSPSPGQSKGAVALPDEHPALLTERRARPARARWGAKPRQRWFSLAIALAIEGLIVLLLLTLGVTVMGEKDEEVKVLTRFTARDFTPPAEPQPEQPAEAQPEESTTPLAVPPAAARPPPRDLPKPERPKPPIIANPTTVPPPPPPPPQAEPAPRASPTIAARINPNSTYGPVDSGPPRTSMDTERVGTAPNGEPLYAARWYREPTDQELAGYLSTASSPGVALIACKTVAGYYVEDCTLLSESPQGAGLGRAVLAAAWQFRVRPARLGGREQFGSWVRIRITYSQSRVSR
ncbi:hypothetical protein [Erythrobacter tepidarius]|uniref:hypothetical protein n=1 Tax=Erythrobacter tepidarius TaxID=60454 RepID=UPI00117D8E7F|nr:hypothetical protein [Erythrobacter tepidarius]